MSNNIGPKVSMSADLEVIPGRPFKGEAKAMGVKSTDDSDDLNLLVALDEPEQLVRALFKIADGLRSNPSWAVIADAMGDAGDKLEELNKPSR